MPQRWLATWKEQRHGYAAGFLASTFLFSLFLFVSWHEARVSISSQKATGLAAVEEGPLGFLWTEATVGGVPGGVPGTRLMALSAEAATDRQIVKQASLAVVVAAPNDAAAAVGTLAERLGGYVVSLTRSEDDDRIQTAELVLRVPAGRFDETRAEIRKLASRVEQEKVESEDITSSFTDRTSRLNSRRAVERQYLEVLRRAASVKDILEVHEKLGEVREEIETAEGELKAMSHRVAMSGITVALRSDAAPVTLGVRWKPGESLKRAANSALQALTDYAEVMAELILRVPVIVLWAVTLFFLGGCAWRFLRWLWRIFIAGRAASVPGA